MSTTDVHRMLDNKLPAGKACTGVRLVEVYTAIIDGAEISIDAPVGVAGYSMPPEAVADLIVAQLGTAENAAPEGGEAEPIPAFFKQPEPEPEQEVYDDDDDEDDDEVDEPRPAPKKKKAKKRR
jgi:hypothetical protein